MQTVEDIQPGLFTGIVQSEPGGAQGLSGRHNSDTFLL